MNRDMKTISTGFLAGFLVAINRMDRLTCYICDSVIHKVMAACLRCEEWEKSLSLFRELCPGTDLGVLDQAATGFLWWKLSTPTLSLARFRRLKLLEEKLRFIGESSQSWAALEELEWFQTVGILQPILEKRLVGWWFHPTWTLIGWIGSSSPKMIKGENKPKLGNLEFRTCTRHVPILLIW